MFGVGTHPALAYVEAEMKIRDSDAMVLAFCTTRNPLGTAAEMQQGRRAFSHTTGTIGLTWATCNDAKIKSLGAREKFISGNSGTKTNQRYFVRRRAVGTSSPNRRAESTGQAFSASTEQNHVARLLDLHRASPAQSARWHKSERAFPTPQKDEVKKRIP